MDVGKVYISMGMVGLAATFYTTYWIRGDTYNALPETMTELVENKTENLVGDDDDVNLI